MAKSPIDRKRLFRSALALADLNVREWAEREGYSRVHVQEYLSGRRVSAPLTQKIDAFIDAWSLRAA